MNHRLPRKSNCFLLFLLFLCLFCSEAAVAGNLDHILSIEGKVATGDYVKSKGTVPITVDVRNNSNENFSGVLSLGNSQYYYRKDQDKYYQDISIPPNAKKRYYLYIPNSSYPYDRIDVKVTRKGDFSKKEVAIRRIQDNDLLFIVLNSQRGGLAYMSNFKSLAPTGSTLNITYPDPALLPLNWKGYDCSNLIIINNLPSLQLDQQRETALLDFVRTGGTLVFSSNLDPNEFNGSQFKNYLPLTPAQTVPAPAEPGIYARQDMLLMGGEVSGTTDLSVGNKPLLVSRQVGEGRIYFLTADLSRAPFTADFEEEKIWTHILDQSHQQASDRRHLDIDSFFSKTPEVSPPPVGIIFWILIVYGILVGPVNYYYLKKKDQLLKLFVTVPAIAIAFSLVLFLMGFSSKGSQILVRNFSIVYTSSGNPAGMVDSAFSIFTPKHLSYNIELLDPGATGWEIGNSYNLPATSIKEGDTITFMNQKIAMWNMRQYRMERSIDLKQGITLNVTAANGVFTGTVVNKTDYRLKDCVLYYQGSLSQPFDLEPGTKQIQLSAQNVMMSPQNITQNLLKIYKLEKGSKTEKETIDIKRAALKNLAEDMIIHAQSPSLMGWSENTVNPVKINHSSGKNFVITLFYVR